MHGSSDAARCLWPATCSWTKTAGFRFAASQVSLVVPLYSIVGNVCVIF